MPLLIETFYLPTFADLRGRIYTLSQYLSYQGDDLCIFLLLFADKKERVLGKKGLEYLLFYFANLYGNNNLTYEARIQWSKDNVMNIYQTFIKDIDLFNEKILPNLKEPFQFISIMFATIKCLNAFYKKEDIVLNKGSGIRPRTGRTTILFDASCNGLQHLAALTREVDIAVKTNLIYLDKSPQVKNDFYRYAAIKYFCASRIRCF